MKPWRRSISSMLAVVLVAGGAYLGIGLMNNSQFARAETQVKDVRDKLASGKPDLMTVFKDVGKAVSPSVVNISVRKTIKAPNMRRFQPDDEWLRRFFPDRDGDGQPDVPDPRDNRGGDGPVLQGTGSGAIVEYDAGKKQAYIITNNHVVSGADGHITITLSDGREIKGGKVLGTDPKSDLAVVRADVENVIPAVWGNSDDLEKGDWVAAFGSPFGYVGSMTHGIVSALHRQAGLLGQMGYENFIQVDAPINPGNSGGPLVNLKGEIVGVNVAIASQSGGFQGVGFAIPSNQAKSIYETLKTKGKVVRGWLGVAIADVAKEKARAEEAGFKGDKGVVVLETYRNTPAFEKLQPGDIVTRINGKDIKDVQALRETIALTNPGTEVKMDVYREGKSQEVAIKVGEQPEEITSIRNPGGAAPNPNESAADALGVNVTDLTPDLAQQFGVGDLKAGAVITKVNPGSPAALAGLKRGDVITRLGGKKVGSADQLVEALKGQDIAKGIRMVVNNREGSQMVTIRTDRE